MTPAGLIKIGLIRRRNPKGKSPEIILLAAFVQTYQRIASEFHNPANLRLDLCANETHGEVSGLSPGRIHVYLLKNSLRVSWPPPISDQTYTSTKPMGKSQEVNLLAVFGMDLLAIACSLAINDDGLKWQALGDKFWKDVEPKKKQWHQFEVVYWPQWIVSPSRSKMIVRPIKWDIIWCIHLRGLKN